jgi:TRAP-type C4-dicarboxylate transport system substrate-binding protein
MSLTNHVWDGFWIIANGPAWKRLPPDVQAVASKVLNEKALLQRSDLAALNQTLADQLRGKGLQVNTADSDTFRAKLRQAGFYDTWHKQIGDDARNLLEHYAGKLG